jgi:hypothetical protein
VKALVSPRKRFPAPPLQRKRIVLALAVAICADSLQLLLNGLGWAGPDQAIDVVAMALTMWILGFHVLLLPTFALELIPVVEDLPTWTACVLAVIALRKREQKATPPPRLSE